MPAKKSIMWFRQDLRVRDNPALHAAVLAGQVLPIYILYDENAGKDKIGAASRVWLHHALKDLSASLDGYLHVYKGDAKTILKKLVKDNDITDIHWNRGYEKWRMDRDQDIKEHFKNDGLIVESHNGSLLWEPWTIQNQSGSHYKVFTPFYRKGCLNAESPREPINKPRDMHFIDAGDRGMPAIEKLGLLRSGKDWDDKISNHWDISEEGAHNQLDHFLSKPIDRYKEGRNNPSEDNVSRLSPYLHFGQISPNHAWYSARDTGQNNNIDHFCSELGWREFSYHLLYNYPDLPRNNLKEMFDDFPWDKDSNALKAWQRGQTGCPMVDAGMRELWETGFMHNRVRMITASFLIKNLLIDWRDGEAWFWECLFDADLASNSASWQWVAGCGADAAPYFRIFNPVLQGQKFDKKGDYVRKYVPELKDLPNKYIHNPWDAPEEVLKESGVMLGETYPVIIVDLKVSRNRALEAYEQMKSHA